METFLIELNWSNLFSNRKVSTLSIYNILSYKSIYQSKSCDILTQMWNEIEICQKKKGKILAWYKANKIWWLKLNKMNDRITNKFQPCSVLRSVKAVLITNEIILEKVSKHHNNMVTRCVFRATSIVKAKLVRMHLFNSEKESPQDVWNTPYFRLVLKYFPDRTRNL